MHNAFSGRLVIVGFGSIGQGVLPLLLRHIDMRPDQIVVITAELRGHEVAEEYGVRFVETALTRENYRAVLDPLARRRRFPAQRVGRRVERRADRAVPGQGRALSRYLHRAVAGRLYRPEPAAFGALQLRAARERAGAAPHGIGGNAGPTAVITHGANPGLVSHFVKQALIDLARDADSATAAPADRAGWARLAERLGVKAIHIAERDTQVSTIPKEPGEFVNTWSIDGFFSEGSQPAELGWGTHERHFPADGRRHDFGSRAAIYLLRPGAGTRVRSWTPLEGPYHGFLITHGESISIADYLTVDGDGGRYGALSPDLPLRLSSVRRRGAEPARAGRQELAAADPQAPDDGRDHRRHRRTRACC